MSSAIDRLIAYLDAEDPYDYRLPDLQNVQLEAANARFEAYAAPPCQGGRP